MSSIEVPHDKEVVGEAPEIEPDGEPSEQQAEMTDKATLAEGNRPRSAT